MGSKSVRKTAKFKAKMRKREARRTGRLKVRKPGGRMRGKLNRS